MNKTTGYIFPQALAGLVLTLALALAPAVARADTTLQLGVAAPGSANESNRTAFLTWTAEAGGIYKVQSSTNVANPAAWKTEDAVSQSVVGPIKWMAPEALQTQKYYRLILPQPQIFSIEPAVVAPGMAVDLYVIGQGFGSSMVLTTNGVPVGAIVVSSSLATVPSFTPDVAGTYRVALVVDGVEVSSFNVVCADALANPELVLQGPPTEPPASPSKKDFKGHVTLLKAFDDEGDNSSARGHTKTGHVTLMKAFDDDSGDSARHTKTGHVTLMKAFDDEGGDVAAKKDFKGHVTLLKGFDDGSEVTFDIQEGKKGLNAVNVKLARSSGEVQQQVVDIAVEGRGLDFVWARTYHSRIGRFGAAPNGWTFSYDVRCAQNSSGGIDVYDGAGRKDILVLQTDGTYTCPELFREVTFNATVVRVTFADTGYWEFNAFDGTATAGKLARIVDRNGNTMTLGYDISGLLAEVVDNLGRANTVAYDTAGRVASVTDFTGRTVTYAYYAGEAGGSPGDLKSVTSPPVTGTPNGNDFPDGKTTTYAYSPSSTVELENHLLVSVKDALGQTTGQFSYDLSAASASYLHCTAAQEGSNTAYRYSWSLVQRPAGSSAVVKCIANDPVGNVTESFFDARNRCVMEREYTGRATPGLAVTDTLNRPTGKLRAEDPDYYETRAEWNNDSLCSRVLLAGGQDVRCVYQSDFDPATRACKRADCRVVRELATSAVDLDGDGVADVTERVWHYEYDPHFGSDPTPSCGKKLYVGNLPFSATDGQFSLRESPTLPTRPTKPSAIRESPTEPSRDRLRESPTLQSLGQTKGSALRESPTLASLRESPTKQSLGLRESPTKQSLGLRESPTKQSLGLRESPTKQSLGFCTSATDPRGNVTTGSYDAKGNPVRVTFSTSSCGVNPPTVNFAYDDHGQWTAITNLPDANCYRRVDTFTWSQGQVVECVVDAGAGGLALTTAFEYDARGNLTRCVDPLGHDSLYTYNALDQCVRSQSPVNLSARCATDYYYDANDNLVQCTTEVRDPTDSLAGSQVSRASYDPLHRLSEIALAVDASHALTNRLVYDGNDQCVQVLGPDAVSGADPYQTAAYQYDERGLLFQATTAAGSSLAGTTVISYTANGNPATKQYVDATDSARISSFSYDGFDRVASATDPMGNQTDCFYDANDNLKVVRLLGELNDVPDSTGNVRLAESRCEYDGLDRCVRAHGLFFDPATQSPIGSGDAVCTWVYAPNDECVSVTDSLGRTTSFGYDTACRLSSATDAWGNLVVSVRDQLGNVTSVTSTELPDLGGSPQVFSCSYAYDTWNRCVSSSDNVGNTFTCAYDSLDRVVRTTNPNGNDTTYAYDLLDNSLACTSYAGSSSGKPATIVRSSQATYDTSSRCLTSTDANGNTTSYAYDSLGDCTTVTQPDGTQQRLVWSPRSNLIGETDANGTVIGNTYDLCDRLVHRDIAARNVLATTTFETFAYDGCSRLVLASNDVSRLDFHYDSFSDCTSSSQDGLAQTATYDSEGNQLSLTYPSGRVVTYAYDTLNQVTNLATTAGGVSHPQLVRYAYAGPGRLTRIGRDNGINTRIDWDGLANPANSAGDYGWLEVGRVRDGSGASPSLVMDRAGTYSRTQSKTALADAVSSHNLTLTYDALDQLMESSVAVGSTPLLDTLYALDANGNRQHVITNGVTMIPDYTMNSALPPGDFLMNRYTTTPFGAQQYDANGNLIVRASAVSPTFYHYDYANRLVEVDGLDNDGTVAPVATFTYDALGDRISKTVYPASPLTPVTTQYVCDVVDYKDGEDGTMHTRPGRILEERVGGVVSQVFVHATGLKEEIRENDNVVFTATGAAQYYHCDDLGNTLALTDSGGTVLERYDYGDYGQPQFLSADGTPLVDSTGQPVTASPLGNPFLFHGMEWDGETGLYSSGTKRFGIGDTAPECPLGKYLDPKTGRDLGGKIRVCDGRNCCTWSRASLSGYFERGDKPTQAQFATLIDSMVNKITDRYLLGLRVSGIAGNNPWGGGGGGGGGWMKKGTVKWFNDAKGF